MVFKFSQLRKATTALMMLFFVVYCSVGVCTNLLFTSSTQTAPLGTAESAHAHHNMVASAENTQQAGHCAEPESCEWSLNPVFDPVSSLDSQVGFFLAYLVAAVCTLFLFSPANLRRRLCYAFSSESGYQPTYPRLHLQKAVFLN